MPLDCSCDVITHAEYRDAARLLGDQVRVARTFGAAAGTVFRATHPCEQSAPAEIVTKNRCQGCMPHIGRAIVEEGLRPQAEFDEWQRRLAAARNDNCRDCPKAATCGVSLDFSPL